MKITEKILFDRLEELCKEYDEYSNLLSSVEICQDNKLMQFYQHKQKDIEEIVLGYRKYLNVVDEINIIEELILDGKDSAEISDLTKKVQELKNSKNEHIIKLQNLYLSNNRNGDQKVRIEMICKSNDCGGLNFVYNMVYKFSEMSQYNIDVIEEKNNKKTLIILGDCAFENLGNLCGDFKIVKNGKESHVQVLVLKENCSEFVFDENDVQIELSKSGGAGGQHINKTESAVKLIHMPTGITAICQDERSQLKNKEKAFIALKEKVLKNFNKDNEKDIQIQRKQMFNAVFSGVSTFVLDFDKNRFIVCDTKNEYKLADVDDALQLIINDVKMLKR